MTEQWFLDLDGVRSGPYQTPEIMSLIAEGEILPHHRISTSLKNQQWVTILDWRLAQAKISQSPVHPSFRSEISTINIEAPNETPPTPHEERVESPITMSPPAEEPAHIQEPMHVQPTPKAKAPPPVMETPKRVPLFPPDQTTSKRDPMAEMFDILQTTKQKREAKQLQAAQQSSSAATAEEVKASQGSGWGKTVVIGAGIVLIGFAFGQLFQQNVPQNPSPTTPVKEAPTPSSASATPHAEVQVLDRSTDKMIIRATVDHHAGAPTPFPSPSKTAGKTPTMGSTEQNEKELEELKNLKKELQELKNLKDNGQDDGEDSDETVGREPAPTNYEQNNNNNPNAYPNNNYPPNTYQNGAPQGNEQAPVR